MSQHSQLKSERLRHFVTIVKSLRNYGASVNRWTLVVQQKVNSLNPLVNRVRVHRLRRHINHLLPVTRRERPSRLLRRLTPPSRVRQPIGLALDLLRQQLRYREVSFRHQLQTDLNAG